MTIFEPLFNASLAVQLHVAGVVVAIAFLPFTLWRRRRDRLHKACGYVWIMAMALAAISSFFLSGLAVIGPFGPIHLISVYVIGGLIAGLRAALSGRIAAHRAHMQGLAFGGLGVAGVLSFMPNRLMAEIAFPTAQGLGFGVVVVVFLAGTIWVKSRRARANHIH